MKAFARNSLVLAAALFGLQQAMACCCLVDPAAHAQEDTADVPACDDCPDDRQADEPQGCPPDCSECAEFESAPSGSVAKAIPSKSQPGFKLPPVTAHTPVAPVRPQTVRIIGPPAAVPRPAQTPVLLKQRLLN